MRLAFLNFNECSHSIYYRIDKSGSILINASSKQPSVIFLGSFYSALTSFTSCIIKLNSVKESLPPPKKTKEIIRPEAKSVNVLDVAYELRDEIEKLKTHKINPLLYFFIEFCKCHRINIYDMHPLDIRKNFMTFIYHKPYFTSVANPIKDMSKESVNDNETRKTKVINKAQKELKEAYDKGQCDVWFDYFQKGKASDARFDFIIHTKESDIKQTELWENMKTQTIYIVKVLQLTYKTDPKFVKRVTNELQINPDLLHPMFDKITKLQKDFKGGEFAKLLRWVLKEDFKIQ